MAIYIIGNDNYLQNGIVLLAKEAGINITVQTIHTVVKEPLSFDDVVILHLNLNNRRCAKAISMLNKKCKLLILLGSTRNTLICDADIVLNAKTSPSTLMLSLLYLMEMKKCEAIKNHILNRIEKIIIFQSLEGRNINLIARLLSLTPKRVYTYRNIACKKLGGSKIHDLLVIKDNLQEDLPIL